MKRTHLLIIAFIAFLLTAAGLQAQQSNQRFQGGGPILAQIEGTGPFYGNETGTNTWYGDNAGASITSNYYNSFFGCNAGNHTTYKTSLTDGNWNSFFGSNAGYTNTTGDSNSFFGNQSGYHNTTGRFNSFYGATTGYANISGNYNSFFGSGAGGSNTTGPSNSFFGYEAGVGNVTGGSNSFFGYQAGHSNQDGYNNSFYGNDAGHNNSTGWANTFFGGTAGYNNNTGTNNSFFGAAAGGSNTSEHNNSFIGALSDGAAGITNSTAIGYRAKVTQSNSLVLGSINGTNGATADTNVGIGTTKPDRQLVIEGSQAIARFTRFMHTADVLAPTFAPAFLFERARGIQAAPGDIMAGDYLGKVQFRGRVGGNMLEYGALTFISTDLSQNGRLAFVDRDMLTERVSFLNSGNVGIGTTIPTERLQVVGNLKVSGSILYGAPATEVPDYVFESGYRLMPIQELEKFISQEKHLPNLPNAGEIKEKGLNLSKFQMKLLEKIEELTLYTVQQAKTIDRKDAEISALNARLSAIEQMLERLTRQGEQK